jgi:hypothetical protein
MLRRCARSPAHARGRPHDRPPATAAAPARRVARPYAEHRGGCLDLGIRAEPRGQARPCRRPLPARRWRRSASRSTRPTCRSRACATMPTPTAWPGSACCSPPDAGRASRSTPSGISAARSPGTISPTSPATSSATSALAWTPTTTAQPSPSTAGTSRQPRAASRPAASLADQDCGPGTDQEGPPSRCGTRKQRQR